MILNMIINNVSKKITLIAIDICFMLSNMVSNDTETTKVVLYEKALIPNLLKIDTFFPNYEVN